MAISGSSHPSFTGYGTSGAAARGISNDTSQFKFTADSLNKFKQYAIDNQTYYRGDQTTLPAGAGPFVVFIDTRDGSEFTGDTPPGHDGSLSLSGSGTFNGIVIVAGTVTLRGNWTINGLVYAINDLSAAGTPTITGGVVSENRRDTSSTSIDTDVSGHVSLTYDCTNIRKLPWSYNWVVKTGGYLEQQD